MVPGHVQAQVVRWQDLLRQSLPLVGSAFLIGFAVFCGLTVL